MEQIHLQAVDKNLQEGEAHHMFPDIIEEHKPYVEFFFEKVDKFLQVIQPDLQNFKLDLLQFADLNSISLNFRNNPSLVKALNICWQAYAEMNVENEEVKKQDVWFEKVFPLCPKHPNLRNLFICENHLDNNYIMCYDCVVHHKEVERSDHAYYFAPQYLAGWITNVSQLMMPTFKLYQAMTKCGESFKNYPCLIEYNAIQVRKKIHEEISQYEKIVERHKLELCEKLEREMEYLSTKVNPFLCKQGEGNVIENPAWDKDLYNKLEIHLFDMIGIFQEKLTNYELESKIIFLGSHKTIIDEFLHEEKNKEVLKKGHQLLQNYSDPIFAQNIPEIISFSISNINYSKVLSDIFSLQRKPCHSLNIMSHIRSMKKSKEYYNQRLKLVSITDNLTCFPLLEMIQGKAEMLSQIQARYSSVKIRDSNNLFVNDNHYIFPMNASKIIMDIQTRQQDNKIVLIGGAYIYTTTTIDKVAGCKSNFLSIFDVNKSMYFRNVYKLLMPQKSRENESNCEFRRVGVKSVLLSPSEHQRKDCEFLIVLFGGIELPETGAKPDIYPKGYIHNDILQFNADFLFIKNNPHNIDYEKDSQSKEQKHIVLEDVLHFDCCQNPQLWESQSHSGCSISNFEVMKMNGKVYIFGGVTAKGAIRNSVIEYDPINQTLKRLAISLPQNLIGFSVCLMDVPPTDGNYIRKIYLIGGKHFQDYLEPAGIYSTSVDNFYSDAPKDFEDWKLMKGTIDKIRPCVTHFENYLIISAGSVARKNFIQAIDVKNKTIRNFSYDEVNEMPIEENAVQFGINDNEYLNASSFDKKSSFKGYDSFSLITSIPKY